MKVLREKSKYFWIFLLIGGAAYIVILFNGFTWDDFGYIINNLQIQNFNLPALLGHNLFNSNIFYRPVPAIYFATLYSVFSQQAFFYHFIQLLLHIFATYLLFIFFCLFFTEGISFFLALVFLVHPINVESVVFIAQTVSELYFIPGILALLLATKLALSTKRLVVIAVLLLFAALGKETGFLFLPLLFLYRYLYKFYQLKRISVAGAAVILVYLFFRLLVGGVSLAKLSFVQIASLSLSQRIANIPAIFSYYIKTFFLPLHLAVWQQWVIQGITWSDFYLPFFILLVTLGAFIAIVIFLFRKDTQYKTSEQKQKQKMQNIILTTMQRGYFYSFLFFLVWFVLGMTILLQIIPLDMTVADRWFYFPIVGLLGMAGVLLQLWHPKGKLVYTVAVILICILSLRTFIRTIDWQSNLTLYAHDLIEEPDNYLLLGEYATALDQSGDMNGASQYASKAVALRPTVTNLNELGRVYQHKRQYEKALSFYSQAIELARTHNGEDESELHAYTNKAAAYIFSNNPDKAALFITKQALKKFPAYDKLYFLLAIAEYNSHHQESALEHAKKALDISASSQNNALYQRIKNNQPIEFKDTT